MHATDALASLADRDFLQDVEMGGFNGFPIIARRLDGPLRAPGWEMHPDTDEWFHILDGHMEVTVVTDEGREVVDLPAGSVFVIPRGHWHQPATHVPTSMIFTAQGSTEWVDGDLDLQSL